MGYCCSNPGDGEVGNLSTVLYPQGATLGNTHYTAKQIFIIVKIQSQIRRFLASRRVHRLRQEIYSPGMGMHHEYGGEDFENVNVQVSAFGQCFQRIGYFTHYQ